MTRLDPANALTTVPELWFNPRPDQLKNARLPLWRDCPVNGDGGRGTRFCEEPTLTPDQF